MSKFQDKVVVVTGGGRDIGRMTCVAFASEGASVVVNYKSSEASALETVRMIEKAGGKGLAVKADVTNSADINRMVDETRQAFGSKIHVLVNNAGGLIARKKISEMDENFWNQVMAVNLGSVFMVTKAYLPHFADGGAIVNLSSLAARDGGGGGAIAYSASKGGVLTMTRGMAKELKPQRIRVNCVSPGLIATTFHDTFTPDEARKNVAAKTLAGREGTAADVANTIVFLASDAAAYVNGESLEVNGGLYFI